MATRCRIPTVSPKAKPTSPMNFVPQRLSNHCPATPGNTISITTVVTCETHSYATASGGRWSPRGTFMALSTPASLTEAKSYQPVSISGVSVTVPYGIVKVASAQNSQFLKAG